MALPIAYCNSLTLFFAYCRKGYRWCVAKLCRLSPSCHNDGRHGKLLFKKIEGNVKMIYIDKCRTDLGISVSEWNCDDYCKFSNTGVVGPGTDTRVLDVTDRFGSLLIRIVVSDSCSDNVSRFSSKDVLSCE